MTQQEMIAELIKDYTDPNGLIKPHKTDGESDNGVLFTSVAQILSNTTLYEQSIQNCYLETGLLNRKPKGKESQQEQWDDLLGRAVRCIQSGNTHEPKQILYFGLKHFGFYNTDNKLEGKDFLFRFVFVFMLLFAGAFPKLKGLVKAPLVWFINSFKCDSVNDTSGLQLQWLVTVGYDLLFKSTTESYWKLKLLMITGKKLSDVFSVYYTPGHPFTLYVKANLDV